MDIYQEALKFHEELKGKLEVTSRAKINNAKDLSLAYTPGVAVPCLEIKDQPENAYKYTAKGNLVAVISNGTAVLGLGNIGALAGKPVMEGKGILFKKFADIDVFDIELNSENTDDSSSTDDSENISESDSSNQDDNSEDSYDSEDQENNSEE